MYTLLEFIDLAKERSGANSYRELAKNLGMAESYMATYRTGRAMPSDEATMKLATAAQIDRVEALAMLNVWRAKTDEAREGYLAMFAKIAATVAAATTLGAATLSSAEADQNNALALPSEAKAPAYINAGALTQYYEKSDLYLISRKWLHRATSKIVAWIRTYFLPLPERLHASKA